MTTKITIENYGTFFIDQNKVGELIKWLQANYINPSIGEVVNLQAINGNQLING